MKKKRIITFCMVGAMSIGVLIACNSAETEQVKDIDKEQLKDKVEQKEEILEPNPKEIMEQYKKSFTDIVNTTGEDGKVLEFTSSNEIIAHFESIMSEELANWFNDTYFEEKEDELFLKAIDGPTWLIEDKPYDVEKVDDGKYKITQEHDNDYLGHSNMIFVIVHDEEKWIIFDIIYEEIVE